MAFDPELDSLLGIKKKELTKPPVNVYDPELDNVLGIKREAPEPSLFGKIKNAVSDYLPDSLKTTPKPITETDYDPELDSVLGIKRGEKEPSFLDKAKAVVSDLGPKAVEAERGLRTNLADTIGGLPEKIKEYGGLNEDYGNKGINLARNALKGSVDLLGFPLKAQAGLMKLPEELSQNLINRPKEYLKDVSRETAKQLITPFDPREYTAEKLYEDPVGRLANIGMAFGLGKGALDVGRGLKAPMVEPIKPIEAMTEQIKPEALPPQEGAPNAIIQGIQQENPIKEYSRTSPIRPTTETSGSNSLLTSPEIKPQESLPVQEVNSTQPIETLKTSGIAKSIEAKAIENGLVDKFENLAGFESRTVKDQAERVSNLITTDPEMAHKIVTGEAPLPQGMSGSMFINGMEEHAKNDPVMLSKLANSKLTSEGSVHAQELRFLAERDPSSAVQIIKDLKDQLKSKAEKRFGDVGKAEEIEIQKIRKISNEVVKKSLREIKTWDSFINSIEC